ncbi:MAG: DUF502 domain-containing protein, partial [Candidatus Omnitrophica bacterium]|nr:DUF502 domain-containing protein [Candidatus Omnitrophota bacterium]
MIKKIFVTGLTASIPLVITIYLVYGLFHFADSILGKYINEFFYEYIGYEVPGLGILIAVLLIFFLGLVLRLSRMKIFRWTERLFFRIPLVNKIYFPVKRIVDFLFFPPQKNFRSAVLVEYPRKGVYSLGFLTNENTIAFKERGTKKLCNVYIPSSPSPITGFIIIVEEKDLIPLDIRVEEAIKLIVSGGLI